MAAGNGTYTGKDQNLGNSLADAVQYLTNKMDEQIVQEAKTSRMTANSAWLQVLNNTGSVKLGTISATGLGTYDRIKGYPVGGAQLTFETYTLANDRAISVTIDRRDTQESGGIATAAATMNWIMRHEVIPELDATRMAKLFSSLAAQNSANSNVVAEAKPTAANVITKIVSGIDEVSNVTGYDDGMTVYVNQELKGLLDASTEVTYVKQVDQANNALTKQVRMLNGAELVFVPSDRMKTTVTLKDGFTNALTDATDPATVDPTKFGFAGGEKSIWFAVTTPELANAVTVINAPKIITADVNQSHDGDTLMYRIYHDLIVPKNQTKAAYMSVQTGALGA